MAYTREQLIAYTRQAAQKKGVDPDIFERQIRQESDNYAPDVVSGQRRSSKGARGVAQIMPEYHPGVNYDDPIESLDYAASLMGDYLRMYNGDYRLALAAYNAGVGSVQEYGGVPPFKQTQDYLRIILGEGNTSTSYPTPGGEQVVTQRQSTGDPIADALAEAGLDNEEDWDNFGEVAGDIDDSILATQALIDAANEKLKIDPNDYLAQQEREAAMKLLASYQKVKQTATTAANKSANDAEQKALDRELKVKLAEYAARNRAKQDETAYTRKVEQDNIDRAIDVYKADLSDKVRSGELSLTAAKTQFDQQMQNYTLRLQRQQMAGGLYNNANDLVLQGAGYAAPPGMDYFPGFGPEKQGLLAKLGRMMGVKLDAVPINRIRFDPRGDVERVLQGGYDWAPVQPTVGGTYGNPPAQSWGGTGTGMPPTGGLPGPGTAAVGGGVPGPGGGSPIPATGTAGAGAQGTGGGGQNLLADYLRQVQALSGTTPPATGGVAAQTQRPVMDVSTPVTPQGMDILGMQQQPQAGWDMAGLSPPSVSSEETQRPPLPTPGIRTNNPYETMTPGQPQESFATAIPMDADNRLVPAMIGMNTPNGGTEFVPGYQAFIDGKMVGQYTDKSSAVLNWEDAMQRLGRGPVRSAVQPARWNPATGEPSEYQMGAGETPWTVDRLRALHQAGVVPSVAPPTPGIRTNNPYEMLTEPEAAEYRQSAWTPANPFPGPPPPYSWRNAYEAALQRTSQMPDGPTLRNIAIQLFTGSPSTETSATRETAYAPPTPGQDSIRTNNPYELLTEPEPAEYAQSAWTPANPFPGPLPPQVVPPTPEEERAYAARHTRARAV